MKVLLLSSEVAPFAKTGGLADVAGALPLALKKLGIDVRVAMPGYSAIQWHGEVPEIVLPRIDVALGQDHFRASVTQGQLPQSDVPIYFINNPGLFHRDGLYQENGRDYVDNPHRFAFFCKAAIWMIKGLGWVPDVIHCNDWQTALVPVLLKSDPAMVQDPELRKIKTLFSIHNMAYQGNFWQEVVAELGLNPAVYHPEGLEYYGAVNTMKGGLVFADKLSTVSPTYAREIQTPAFGCGLDGVLRNRAQDLSGILNGINYDEWNPATDKHLPAHFSAEDLRGKAACKRALQEELGLKTAADVPLLVMISRLDPQKGLDILLPALPEILQKDVQLAVLGTGRADYESMLAEIAQRHPGQMAVTLKFDNGLAHRMEAGGDIFLMPSHFEPCGLNQLYSLRYGTLPLVRRTGGLADSVEALAPDARWGTGFVMEEYLEEELLKALQQALNLYKMPDLWKKTQVRAMNKDFSWAKSAQVYADLYEEMAGARA